MAKILFNHQSFGIQTLTDDNFNLGVDTKSNRTTLKEGYVSWLLNGNLFRKGTIGVRNGFKRFSHAPIDYTNIPWLTAAKNAYDFDPHNLQGVFNIDFNPLDLTNPLIIFLIDGYFFNLNMENITPEISVNRLLWSKPNSDASLTINVEDIGLMVDPNDPNKQIPRFRFQRIRKDLEGTWIGGADDGRFLIPTGDEEIGLLAVEIRFGVIKIYQLIPDLITPNQALGTGTNALLPYLRLFFNEPTKNSKNLKHQTIALAGTQYLTDSDVNPTPVKSDKVPILYDNNSNCEASPVDIIPLMQNSYAEDIATNASKKVSILSSSTPIADVAVIQWDQQHIMESQLKASYNKTTITLEEAKQLSSRCHMMIITGILIKIDDVLVVGKELDYFTKKYFMPAITSVFFDESHEDIQYNTKQQSKTWYDDNSIPYHFWTFTKVSHGSMGGVCILPLKNFGDTFIFKNDDSATGNEEVVLPPNILQGMDLTLSNYIKDCLANKTNPKKVEIAQLNMAVPIYPGIANNNQKITDEVQPTAADWTYAWDLLLREWQTANPQLQWKNITPIFHEQFEWFRQYSNPAELYDNLKQFYLSYDILCDRVAFDTETHPWMQIWLDTAGITVFDIELGYYSSSYKHEANRFTIFNCFLGMSIKDLETIIKRTTLGSDYSNVLPMLWDHSWDVGQANNIYMSLGIYEVPNESANASSGSYLLHLPKSYRNRNLGANHSTIIPYQQFLDLSLQYFNHEFQNQFVVYLKWYQKILGATDPVTLKRIRDHWSQYSPPSPETNTEGIDKKWNNNELSFFVKYFPTKTKQEHIDKWMNCDITQWNPDTSQEGFGFKEPVFAGFERVLEIAHLLTPAEQGVFPVKSDPLSIILDTPYDTMIVGIRYNAGNLIEGNKIYPIGFIYKKLFTFNTALASKNILNIGIRTCTRAVVHHGILFLYGGEKKNAIFLSTQANEQYFSFESVQEITLKNEEVVQRIIKYRENLMIYTNNAMISVSGNSIANLKFTTINEYIGITNPWMVAPVLNYMYVWHPSAVYYQTSLQNATADDSRSNLRPISILVNDQLSHVKDNNIDFNQTMVVRCHETAYFIMPNRNMIGVYWWYADFTKDEPGWTFYTSGNKYDNNLNSNKEFFRNIKFAFSSQDRLVIISYQENLTDPTKSTWEFYYLTNEDENQYYDGEISDAYPYSFEIITRAYDMTIKQVEKRFRNAAIKILIPPNPIFDATTGDYITPKDSNQVNFHLGMQLYIDGELSKPKKNERDVLYSVDAEGNIQFSAIQPVKQRYGKVYLGDTNNTLTYLGESILADNQSNYFFESRYGSNIIYGTTTYIKVIVAPDSEFPYLNGFELISLKINYRSMKPRRTNRNTKIV